MPALGSPTCPRTLAEAQPGLRVLPTCVEAMPAVSCLFLIPSPHPPCLRPHLFLVNEEET